MNGFFNEWLLDCSKEILEIEAISNFIFELVYLNQKFHEDENLYNDNEIFELFFNEWLLDKSKNDIQENLAILKPLEGENLFDAQDENYWLTQISHYMIEGDQIEFNSNLKSFNFRKIMLALIKNVILREPTHFLAEMFSDLAISNFNGEYAPVVDRANSIDDIKLIKRVDDAISKLFGFRFITLLKLGLLSIEYEKGEFKLSLNSLKWSLLHRFHSHFNLRNIGAGEVNIPLTRSNYQQKRFLARILTSIILSGYQERIRYIDSEKGISVYFNKIIPNTRGEGELMNRIFPGFKASYAKPTIHTSIVNQFIDKFSNWYENNEAERFLPGRSVLISVITKKIESSISASVIKEAFKSEINQMVTKALSILSDMGAEITPELRAEVFEEQVKTKRIQVIRRISSVYKERILNPVRPLSPSKPIRTIGDIAMHIRSLLDGTKSKVQLIYSGKEKVRFFQSFTLELTREDFTSEEISKIVPTLLYTWYKYFDKSKRDEQVLKSLFDAETLFDDLKESINTRYRLFEKLIGDYLINNKDIQVLNLRFFKEYMKGFHSGFSNIHSYISIGNVFREESLIKEELAGTMISFNLREQEGTLNTQELKKLVANLIYYMDQYDSIAYVLNSDNPRLESTKTVLLASSDDLLDVSYLISTYGNRDDLAIKEMASKDIYERIYLNGKTFKEYYSEGSVPRLCHYALQGENNVKMRSLYEKNFQVLSGLDNILVKLGYQTKIV